MYGRTMPDLTHKRYTAHVRPQDRFVRLYDEDIGACSLFYFLIAAEKRVTWTATSDLKPTLLEFSYFQLLILSGFFFLPPSNGGDFFTMATGFPRYSLLEDHPLPRPPMISDPRISWRSSSVQDCIGMAQAGVASLAASTVKRVQRLLPGEAEMPADLYDLLMRFEARPIVM
jgi:hypothetical protein